MSKDTNQVLGHGDEADGIEEYDNPLPDWWLGLFFFTIVWAVGYTVHYHMIADRSQEKALAAEVAAAEIRWPETSEGTVEFVMSDEAVAAGEAVYQANCLMCHGADMEGGIGPSFLDEEWLHGSTSDDIIRVITEGVPEKGMLSWGPILGPEPINQVTAYVMSRSGLQP